MSVLALIDRLLAQRPGLEHADDDRHGGLGAAARPDACRPRARHQFVPVDLPRAVERFLDHWRPDLAIWVESELWPNLVLATQRRGIPMLLLNGRLSARSFGALAPRAGADRGRCCMLSRCAWRRTSCRPARFRALGARTSPSVGDLKAAAAPLAADPAALAALAAAGSAIGRSGSPPARIPAKRKSPPPRIADRARASRPADDHRAAPSGARSRRSPRCSAAQGLRVARRGARRADCTRDTDIYLADTLGELGLFYRAGRHRLYRRLAGRQGRP